MRQQHFRKQVRALKFSLLSPDKIKKLSTAKIVTPELYDIDGFPVDGGLMDLRLGAIDPGVRCRTCGKRVKDLVKTNLKKYADSNQILTLFKLLEKDLSFFIENAFDGALELEALQKECSIYGLPIKISPTMIRGLGYYTGNIFEVVAKSGLSIAGGGRYDKVVGKYLERDIPAVGISFGLERVTELADIDISSIPKALVLSIGQDKASVKLAQKIREGGISCIFSSEKVGKALEYANSYSIPYVVFVGENEIAKKKFKVRDMKSGKEDELTEKGLIKMLAG